MPIRGCTREVTFLLLPYCNVLFFGGGGCHPFVDTSSLYQLIRVVWRFASTLIVIRNGDT